MKTFGKHEVPMLEEKEEKKVGGEQTDGKGKAQRDGGSAKQKSALNKIAQLNSPVPRRHVSLHPNGVKLPTSPMTVLSIGTENHQNIHKSSSTPSLRTKAPIGTATDQQQKRNDFDRTVPNAAQMLLAARNREKQMATASPRTVGTRLPPLQLPQGSKRTDEHKREETEKRTNFNGTKDEGQGMIATVATRPLPQLQLMRQPQNAIEHSALAQPLPPPPYDGTDVLRKSLPIHSNNANVPPNQSLNNFQSVPRRRPSSADAITTNTHKPLPSISAQLGAAKRHDVLSRDGNFTKRGANRFQCRTAVKCALVGVFFSVPVLIFALIMLFSSDGFSSHSDVAPPSSSQSPPPSVAFPTTAGPSVPIPAPTDVNIVGGAIFQPISMQNASGDAK